MSAVYIHESPAYITLLTQWILAHSSYNHECIDVSLHFRREEVSEMEGKENIDTAKSSDSSWWLTTRKRKRQVAMVSSVTSCNQQAQESCAASYGQQCENEVCK